MDEGYQMSMTPEAKRALSGTIRALRTRLLDDLHAATEGAYRLSLKAKDAKLSEEARIRRERFDNWISEQVRALPKKEQGRRQRPLPPRSREGRRLHTAEPHRLSAPTRSQWPARRESRDRRLGEPRLQRLP